MLLVPQAGWQKAPIPADKAAEIGVQQGRSNHPGDTPTDMSRSDDLSALVERPTDIKRLIDFMLDASSLASNIDPKRIGFFGFSRGGYSGLVLVGARPDWACATTLCRTSSSHMCEKSSARRFQLGHSHTTRGSMRLS
jgi:predicted dienelactone hydrolase